MSSPGLATAVKKESTPPQILSAFATPLVTGLLIPPLKGKWMRMAVPLAGQDLDLPNSLLPQLP